MPSVGVYFVLCSSSVSFSFELIACAEICTHLHSPTILASTGPNILSPILIQLETTSRCTTFCTQPILYCTLQLFVTTDKLCDSLPSKRSGPMILISTKYQLMWWSAGQCLQMPFALPQYTKCSFIYWSFCLDDFEQYSEHGYYGFLGY